MIHYNQQQQHLFDTGQFVPISDENGRIIRYEQRGEPIILNGRLQGHRIHVFDKPIKSNGRCQGFRE